MERNKIHMTMFSVQPAGKDDVSFLWEMLYQSIFTPEGQDPPSREVLKSPSISKYVDGWGREGDIGLIAINTKGEPIGAVTLRFFDESNKGYGFVDSSTPELGMAVIEEYRGMGVGTELMKRVFQEVKNRGIRSISLSVDPGNRAMNMYKRFGFVEVGMEGTSVTMQAIIKCFG